MEIRVSWMGIVNVIIVMDLVMGIENLVMELMLWGIWAVESIEYWLVGGGEGGRR